MAKFYQHMQPGDTLGKITRLRYIDDVSDDELTLYVFDDETKCDEQYIAEINSTEAFGKFVMVELTDPLNKWSFKTSEYKMSTPKTVIGDDGQEYEIPDPGISITRDQNNNYIEGEHTFISTSDDGVMKPRTMPFDGKRIEATPPRIVRNKTVEPKENYLLSLHPELVDGPIHEDSTQVSTDLLSHSVKRNRKNTQVNSVNNMLGTANQQIMNAPKSPITTNVIETVKHASIVIDIDSLVNANEYDSVKIIVNGTEQELPIIDFVNKLTVQKPEQVQEQAVVESPVNEDPFITNIIDKSKKQSCVIGVDFELELPPIEVYKTIKGVYSDELASEFVTSLARRMNVNTLKEAVAEGLTMFYNENGATKNS